MLNVVGVGLLVDSLEDRLEDRHKAVATDPSPTIATRFLCAHILQLLAIVETIGS